MSWKDNLENIKFQITTGDGNTWLPKWFPRGKVVELNNTIYDYPNLSGSLVDRRAAKGDKYSLDVAFEGEQAIADSEAFLRSAKDPRAWTILHPYHGTINAQPIRLNVDNSAYNISRITIEVVDSLLSELQFTQQELRGELLELKSELDTQLATAYTAALFTPISSDAAIMQDNINTWDGIQSRAINLQRELGEFKELVTTATNAASNLISDATTAVRQFNTLLEFPFRVRSTVQDRFNTFLEQYNTARSSIDELTGNNSQPTSARNKYFFANQGVSLIASACLVSVLEPDAEETDEDSEETIEYSIKNDYKTRAQIVEQIDNINAFYHQFLTDSDTLETERADKTSSYHLDSNTSFTLQQIVTETVRNLEGQIFGALQERSYIVPADSNIIVLAHRLLGLDSEDQNINSLIETNGISISELQAIRRGRELVYYV